MTAEETRSTPQTAGLRPWPVRTLTLLFSLEALGFLILGFLNRQALELVESPSLEEIIRANIDRLANFSIFTIFVTLGLLSIFVVLSFLWVWRTGWASAMLLQALSLLIALILYFRGSPPYYTYPIMIYAIIIVVYLHHPDVQTAFKVKYEISSREPH